MDQVINEIDVRFSHKNTRLVYAAVCALQPKNSNLKMVQDVKMVQPLLDLVDRTSVEAEFDVAETYAAKFNGDEKTENLMLLRRTLQNSTVIRRQSQQQPNSFLHIVKHLRRCLQYILQ